MNNEVEIVLYGAEQLCPSCVNLPSSKETFEWLEERHTSISKLCPNNNIHHTFLDTNPINMVIDEAHNFG